MPLHYTPEFVDRFWSRVSVSDNCWYWTTATDKLGYGRITFQYHTYYAHRVAYELTYGPIPDGLFICHGCDTPPCVRPDHMFLGTPAQNSADRVAKGRNQVDRSELDALLVRIRGPRPRGTLADRLWANVQKTDTCWLWTGKVANNGYGRTHDYTEDNQICWVSVHRASYALAYGPIPDGLQVCHRCDIRHCVRPDHLFLGTQADNMADAVAKGHRAYGTRNGKYTMPERTPRGEANGEAKLTADQVREIRRRHAAGGIGQRRLAAEYGVVKTAIANILHRKTWRDLD